MIEINCIGRGNIKNSLFNHGLKEYKKKPSPPFYRIIEKQHKIIRYDKNQITNQEPLDWFGTL